jgi:hypothetical protein
LYEQTKTFVIKVQKDFKKRMGLKGVIIKVWDNLVFRENCHRLKTVMGITLDELFPFTLENLRFLKRQATVIVTGIQRYQITGI